MPSSRRFSSEKNLANSVFSFDCLHPISARAPPLFLIFLPPLPKGGPPPLHTTTIERRRKGKKEPSIFAFFSVLLHRSGLSPSLPSSLLLLPPLRLLGLKIEGGKGKKGACKYLPALLSPPPLLATFALPLQDNLANNYASVVSVKRNL